MAGADFPAAQAQNTRDIAAPKMAVRDRITIGMSSEQVVKIWGRPRKIIKKNAKDFDEIWVYSPNWKFKNYLYFKNGILVKGQPAPGSLM